MAKNRLVALLLLAFTLTLSLAGCDSTQDLQNQVKQLTQQNEELRQQIASLTAKTAQYQNAASLYQGCMALGVFSNLCPGNIMTEGKQAIDAGFPGGGWPYWIALSGKLSVVLISAGLGFLVFWRGVIAWIEPAQQKLNQARKTIEQAEDRAQQARSREMDAEAKHERIRQQIRASQNKLESLREAIGERQEELDQLDQEIQHKKQDLNALGGFL
jgi:peptidoglycan hydrolase CwlO-like protein